MLFLAFHGEGILYSFLAHLFFGGVAVASLIYGLLRRRSKLGVLFASIYLLPTLAVGALLRDGGGAVRAQFAASLVTLPWNLIVPCYNLDTGCDVTPVVLLICAGLNASVLYYLGLWVSRGGRARHPANGA